ncbi:MAG: hypothetical protein WA188_16205 [Terriglobales bacterium]
MHTVKSIGVLSFAKMNAAVYGAMGLLFMPIILLISLAGAFAGPKNNPLAGALGVVLALMMPVLYAGMGFVTGLLGSLIYNLIAKWLGGIEIELQPPPSPRIATSATAG